MVLSWCRNLCIILVFSPLIKRNEKTGHAYIELVLLVLNAICLGLNSYRLKVWMLFLIVCLFERPHFVEFSCLLRQFPFVISNLYNLDY